MKQPSFKFLKKKKDEIRLIYLSRIHPIKNLLFLLSALESLRLKINFTIVGTIEDELYWNQCQKYIERLPTSIDVKFEGEVLHEYIHKKLQEHHLFILPTTGENFGHAIFESFLAGRPVLISNQTPWQNLERERAGWVLSLGNPKTFAKQIKMVANMNQQEYNKWSKGAWLYAKKYIENSTTKEKYLKLFS